MNNKLPNGLVFSSRSPKRKTRTLILVTVLFVLQICLIWPIYPFFASPTPQILGFPLSIIWVVFILILAFTSVLLFFRKDIKEES